MSEFEAKPWVQWFGATPDHKPDYVEMVEQEVRQLMESRGLPKDDKNIEHALACAYMRGIDSVDKYLRNSLSAYRNSVRWPQWISVKERLPESGKVVLVAMPKGTVTLGGIHKKTQTFDVFLDMAIWTAQPTHWMPLPSVEGLKHEG